MKKISAANSPPSSRAPVEGQGGSCCYGPNGLLVGEAPPVNPFPEEKELSGAAAFPGQ